MNTVKYIGLLDSIVIDNSVIDKDLRFILTEMSNEGNPESIKCEFLNINVTAQNTLTSMQLLQESLINLKKCLRSEIFEDLKTNRNIQNT